MIKGIIHVTGEHDAGKTTLAMSCGVQPKDMAFIDDDVKTGAIVDELKEQGHKFGIYRNLRAEGRGMTEIALHTHCLGIIDDIESRAPFKAIVWDTWSRFEETFHPWVDKHPGKFRETWSPMGAIKGAQRWISSFDYEAEVLDRLRGLADMVFVVTHLKKHRLGGKETGKMIPRCKRPMTEVSQLRIWLRHNPDGPEPIGLVLKRIAKRTVTDEGIMPVSVLPRRIVPCTWAEITRYWNEPVGNRELEAHEIPSKYELSILDGTLTEDQKMIFKLAEVENGVFTSEAEHEELGKKVRELKESGMKPRKIGRELGLSEEEVERYW